MNFKLVRTKEEYIKFINDVQDKFGCNEDWEDFFGFKLKWNEETGDVLETIFEYQGELRYCPDSFPAIVYYLFDNKEDRLGNCGIRILDFTTFEELSTE